MKHTNRIMTMALAIAAIIAALSLTGSAFAATDADVYTKNPIAKIAKQASPAVVNIDTETMVTRSPHPFANDPFFREFFGHEFDGFNRTVPMRGKGSGFIVSKDGHILTNHHVVDGADKISVTMMDGRSLEAELVGKDPTFDLAVIKVKADSLPTLELGDSDAAEVGEWVVAIGNPHGFEHTVTAGIISAKNRTIQDDRSGINLQGFMQTDAAINPGNSGGPLIDLNGRVVGINTAIVPYAQGIGFAVPVNMARQVMDDLIKHGEVKRGWLGVVLQPVTASLAEQFKLPNTDGAIIADVNEGSPAEKAGFKRGDIITAIEGKAVKNSGEVQTQVRGRLAGDKISVDVFRDGKKTTLSVTLGSIPGGSDAPGKGRRGKGGSSERIGATVREIDEALKKEYDLPSDKGLVVVGVKPGSLADRLGLREGDRILEVNRSRVEKLADWEKIVDKDEDKIKSLVLLISRDGQTLFLSTR